MAGHAWVAVWASIVHAWVLHAMQVGNLLGQAPDLSFPIRAEQAQTWLLTTYLDNDTRIDRGDGGSVFIMSKASINSTSDITITQV